MSGQIAEYNPEKDVLIIRATVGNNALGIESQDAIEIPASRVTGVDNIPITIAGEKTTIGVLRGGAKKPTSGSQDMFIFPEAGQSASKTGKKLY
jgi:hypothetical protein